MTKTDDFTISKLAERVLVYYLSSMDANGLSVQTLINEGYKLDTIKLIVVEAVNKGYLEVVFSETDTNAHIRRIPNKLKKPFEVLIKSCKIENACLYPSEKLLSNKADFSKFKDSPYTLDIWEGKAQLEYVFFDLKVLLPYHNDPRYALNIGSLGGSLFIADDKILGRDSLYIEHMDVSYSKRGERVLGVMLRYLCDLSPSHQRIWSEHEIKGKCKVNELSFNAAYFGSLPNALSIYDALLEEIKVINQICLATFKIEMFKSDFIGKKPDYYHILLISTEREYRNFASGIDEILSENLNMDFFKSFPEIVGEIGKSQLGTIGSLKLWLDTFWKSSKSNIKTDVIDGINLARKERSIGSHGGYTNKYDVLYIQKQKDLMHDVYSSVRNIRLILQNLPAGRKVEIPDRLNGKIINP